MNSFRVCAALLLCVAAHAQVFTQQGSKLVGTGALPTGDTVDQGYSVALSSDGNTALVGGFFDNEGAGAVWVFTRDAGGNWSQQGGKLVGTGAIDGLDGANQGISVALSADGNTALVGGPGDNNQAGAAWVFTRGSSGVWTQQGGKLVGSGAVGAAYQGRSVALSSDGNTALVGGPNDTPNGPGGTGAVWVFTRDGGGNWSQQGSKLVGSGAVLGANGASEGYSVALSADGNTALVGGSTDNSSAGAVWVFTRNGSGNWSQQGPKLVGTGATAAAEQGASVALSGDGNTALVGGPADSTGIYYAGAVWVFTRDGTGAWTQQGAKLVGNGVTGVYGASQGASVSLSADGNTALVGGPDDNVNMGAAWVFARNGGSWSQQGSKLMGAGANTNAGQGQAVALSGDGSTALIGGPFEINSSGSGAAWPFVRALVVYSLYSIEGQITLNGSPLAGVTVSLNNGSSAQTDGSGSYSFGNLMAGANYVVTPSLLGYGFVPGSATFNNLSGNQSSNFTATAIVYTIGGQITLNGSALAGVTVSLSNGSSTQTNGTGAYSFGNVAAGGNYVVTPSLQGYGFLPGSATFNNLSGNQSANFTALSGSGALQFKSVVPCRIGDTRNASGPFGAPLITGGTSRDFAISNSACGIPSTAQAYSLNVTVVPSGPLGYLTVWPSGQSQPLVSTLNSLDGRVKANAAIVPAGANGAISVFASNDSNVVLDIDGYFVPAASSAALAFYPLAPCRIADTRAAVGSLGGPYMPAGQDRTFPVLSSSCNIPSGAQAYSLNFTAVPHTPLGYLTTWPTGQTQPLVSTLNAPTGAVTANAAIVPAGNNGGIDVFVTNDTDVIVDINGYFAPVGTGGLSLYILQPCRVIDTRNPSGSQPFSGELDVNVAPGACALPSTAQAFVFNATVVPPAPLGYVTLWPQGQTQPVVSTLNSLDGTIVSNMAIVPTTDGLISAFASNPTHLIVDVSSYFAP